MPLDDDKDKRQKFIVGPLTRVVVPEPTPDKRAFRRLAFSLDDHHSGGPFLPCLSAIKGVVQCRACFSPARCRRCTPPVIT